MPSSKLSMRQLAETARANGIEPVMAYVPLTREEPGRSASRRREILAMGERAGFRTFSLAEAYGERDPVTLEIADWDRHPNRIGHQLIAERLLEVLAELSEGEATVRVP